VRGDDRPTFLRRERPGIRMTRNVVRREDLRRGVVECPLCGRQIAAPTDHLIVYGAVDRVTAENADAVECPACGGATFVEDGTSEPG
jgi:ribosomal protein S27E